MMEIATGMTHPGPALCQIEESEKKRDAQADELAKPSAAILRLIRGTVRSRESRNWIERGE
jgi:hypothetical protein